MYSVLRVVLELTVNTNIDLQTQQSDATKICETKVSLQGKSEDYCLLETVTFTLTVGTHLPSRLRQNFLRNIGE
jgi:hypothetical protein